MHSLRTAGILLPVLLAISGCAMTPSGPSLAPRAVEQLTAQAPTPQPLPPPIPEDASQQQRVAALLAQARDGNARFKAQLATAEQLAETGVSAPMGGEAWVQAQEALSRVEDARSPIAQSLADLDALQIAAAQNGIAPDSAQLLADAVNEVTALDRSEDEALRSLRSRFSAP